MNDVRRGDQPSGRAVASQSSVALEENAMGPIDTARCSPGRSYGHFRKKILP